MLGAFIGDFVGSCYEHVDLKGFNLPLTSNMSFFTDDSIMSAATLMTKLNSSHPEETLREWCEPRIELGFSETLKAFVDGEDISYYESDGNGAAIRVSPLAYFHNDLKSIMDAAKENALMTHTGNEAVKGAQAIAACVFLARKGHSADEIKQAITSAFQYDLNLSAEDLHKEHEFTTQASVTVPIAIFIALKSRSMEHCLRLGLHIGGDVDSILSMAAAIKYAGNPKDVPEGLVEAMFAKAKLSDTELANVLEKARELGNS